MNTHDAEQTPNFFSIDRFSHPLQVRRSAVALIIVFVCVARSSAAIRASASLGAMMHYDIPFTPVLPVCIHYTSTKTVDIACIDPSSSQLVILRNNGSGVFSQTIPIAKVPDVTALTVGDLNEDGIDDIVIVRREQRQIEILLSSSADSSYTAVRYPVRYYPDQALLADIDNDRIPDIISYGKVSSGITVLRGLGGGKFADAQELFPDIPVSDVFVRKLNGDNYADVILYNWLSGEMIFSIGMGGLQFAEQTTMPFQKDSSSIVFLKSNADVVTDFAMTLPEKKTIQFFEGDGLGAYLSRQTLDMNINATHLEAVHIRSQQFDDVLATNGESGMFSLYLNRGDGTFDDEIQFGGGEGVMLHGDVDGDGLEDLIEVPARGRTMQIYYNGQKVSDGVLGAASVSYPVGKTPSALAVADFNNDGRDDIAVVNTGSSTLSLLLSSEKPGFIGQRSFETVASPTSVKLYSKSDSSLTFLFAHTARSRVSVLSLSEHVHGTVETGIESQFYTIPTGERPSLIVSELAVQKKTIEFYVASGPSQQMSLSYYQQVKGARFIERSFKPIIPARILAGAVTDFNGDGRPDLAYVYGDQSTGRNVLGITFSDSTGQYHSNTQSYVFPDSVMKRCYLYFDDFDGDNNIDCLLAQSPANTLSVALGSGGGKFRDIHTIASSVPITGSEQVQLIDFNGDGVPDVVFMNAATSELFLLRGKGNGLFYEKQYLLDVPADGAFRCADMNGDGVTDVITTDPKRNCVTIHYANPH